MPELISHMICAPEFDGAGHVIEIHVTTGDWVARDARLASVRWEDGEAIVHAPDAGSVSALLVGVGDMLGSGELLLMMEIEEADTGWLPLDLPAACEVPALPSVRVPAAVVSSDVLQVSRDAAALAARLGVDLSQVQSGARGVIEQADVERYVRNRLAGPQ
ncbi:Biotin-requiring enzyme [Andreprevotia lacus DSM 23236]|jgi:pyruvate/2-oxoglutarate dehydrogenase complex dihydrolipoamide acyltransferase (E2) component|uniref:Biotin-requiring enzyme n=1 Tax=Andreprevotia lacus DSM 23236 TaxID=1121001 RepID=A0A1W1XUQ1_9NEIS|nr:biotin/lipoyl-containing protein [Andreprevotia lacus]SMC27564.1 Biotin-requiring enzyme [Andreprevotia lacus DSM 23236]